MMEILLDVTESACTKMTQMNETIMTSVIEKKLTRILTNGLGL